MHPGRRAAMQEQAHRRIVMATETLAARFGLDGHAIPTTLNVRNPLDAALEQQQAVAALLEALVEATTDQGEPGDALAGLNVPAPVRASLAEAGIDTPDALAEMSDDDLLALPGIGPKALGQIRAAVPHRAPAPVEPGD